MVYDNILDAVGHTPLVRLNRVVEPGMARVLVKFEAVNVGGSIKTRTAARMIRSASNWRAPLPHKRRGALVVM